MYIYVYVCMHALRRVSVVCAYLDLDKFVQVLGISGFEILAVNLKARKFFNKFCSLKNISLTLRWHVGSVRIDSP